MSQLEEFIIDPEPEVILVNSTVLQCTTVTDQNIRILGNPRPVPSKSKSWVFEGHYFGLIRGKWADNKSICNLCHPINSPDPTEDTVKRNLKGVIVNCTTVAINHLKLQHNLIKDDFIFKRRGPAN